MKETLSKPPIELLLCLYLLVWVASHLVSDTNLDPYGDMLENFYWGQEFSWGEAKHPPLVGWITGLWFSLTPTTHASYFFLSYGTAAIGLYGVYILGKQLGLGQLSVAATLILTLSLPFSTLAIKFNANSVLLLLWPWVVVTWLISQQAMGARAYAYAILLGLLAALALLGKYYSGVLLLSLASVTVFTATGRQWLKTPKPWLAGALCCALLLPHYFWLEENKFITFAYVEDQGDGDLKQFGKFLFVPFFYWLFAWVASVVAMGQFPRGLLKAWLPKGKDDLVFWLAVSPFFVTLLFGLSGLVTLSLPWAIPLGFAFSILWFRNLAPSDVDQVNEKVRKIFMGWLVLVLLVSPVYAWQQGRSGQANYYQPRQEAVLMTLSLWDSWQSKHDNPVAISWVSGEYPEMASIALYGQSEIQIRTDFDEGRAGLVFCPLGQVERNALETGCTLKGDAWHLKHPDKIIALNFVTSKSGPRFFKEVPHSYKVYFYEP